MYQNANDFFQINQKNAYEKALWLREHNAPLGLYRFKIPVGNGHIDLLFVSTPQEITMYRKQLFGIPERGGRWSEFNLAGKDIDNYLTLLSENQVLIYSIIDSNVLTDEHLGNFLIYQD